MAKMTTQEQIDEFVGSMTNEQLMAWAINRGLVRVIEEHIMADYVDWNEGSQKEYLKDIRAFVKDMKHG